MRRLSKRTWTIGSASAVLILGGGAAFAYWTNTGSGTGEASTGSNATIVVNQTSSITGLAPGQPAQTLSGNFDNPNDGPVYVTTVTATVTGTDKTGCGPTDYTIGGSATVNAEVPSGTGVGSWTGLTIAFNNKPAVNQDACKNAVVSIAYVAHNS